VARQLTEGSGPSCLLHGLAGDAFVYFGESFPGSVKQMLIFLRKKWSISAIYVTVSRSAIIQTDVGFVESSACIVQYYSGFQYTCGL